MRTWKYLSVPLIAALLSTTNDASAQESTTNDASAQESTTNDASAQEAPTTPANPPPDVVMLKDGGILRGSIQELVPNETVDIVLSDGTRRRLSFSNIQYAGPAANTPPATHVGTSADAKVHVITSNSSLRLHRRVGTTRSVVVAGGVMPMVLTTPAFTPVLVPVVVAGATYEDVCVAPCDATLPSGTHTLALSSNGLPVEAQPVTLPPGHSTLIAEYTSHRSDRIKGVTAFVLMLTAGLAVVTYGLVGFTERWCAMHVEGVPDHCFNMLAPNELVVAGGAALLLGSLIPFVILYKRDTATLRVTPTLSTALGRRRLEGGVTPTTTRIGLTLAF